MQPIVAYPKDQVLSDNEEEAYKLKRRSAHFVLLDNVFCTRGFSFPYFDMLGRKSYMYSP